VVKRLKHPNIVRYLGVRSDDAKLYIFLELVPGGSIASMLVRRCPLHEPPPYARVMCQDCGFAAVVIGVCVPEFENRGHAILAGLCAGVERVLGSDARCMHNA
jgi:serine/threonine protein kinase